jgi:hypothetical protein
VQSARGGVRERRGRPGPAQKLAGWTIDFVGDSLAVGILSGLTGSSPRRGMS